MLKFADILLFLMFIQFSLIIHCAGDTINLPHAAPLEQSDNLLPNTTLCHSKHASLIVFELRQVPPDVRAENVLFVQQSNSGSDRIKPETDPGVSGP
jgi:hypothetical protein